MKRSKAGDHSAYTEEFRQRHSSGWRLTKKGVEQAQKAGQWLRDNVNPRFDRYYTSEYPRAMETAALLGLEEARWFPEFYLRERDRGVIDVVTHEELQTKYLEVMQRRRSHSYYWAPPGGESMAQVCMRVERVLATLEREFAGKRAIIVCHGEVMWAFRIRLERLSQARYMELDESTDSKHRLHNGQILHYTSKDPHIEGHDTLTTSFRWVRSVCPTDTTLSPNEWEDIQRPVYTNEQMLAFANTHKPLLIE